MICCVKVTVLLLLSGFTDVYSALPRISAVSIFLCVTGCCSAGFKGPPQHSQHHKDCQHCRYDKVIRTESDEAEQGNCQPQKRTRMILFFEPLLHKDHHEHSRHNEFQSFRVEMDQGTEDSSQCRT